MALVVGGGVLGKAHLWHNDHQVGSGGEICDFRMFRDFFWIAIQSMEQIQYGEPLLWSNLRPDNPVPEHTLDGRTAEIYIRHSDPAVMENLLHGVRPLRAAAPGAGDAKKTRSDEASHDHRVGSGHRSHNCRFGFLFCGPPQRSERDG